MALSFEENLCLLCLYPVMAESSVATVSEALSRPVAPYLLRSPEKTTRDR